MTASIAQFPVLDQRPEAEPAAPSSMLSARVAVGVRNATEFMCSRLVDIAHADDRAKTVAMLMFLELVGRVSSDPDVKVTQLLEALYEQIPEETRSAAGVRL